MCAALADPGTSTDKRGAGWGVLVPVAPTLALALALAACGGKGGGGNGNNNGCPDGFRPEGRACVPIFDDCPGPAEIPVLGGGCQPVGVTECATGFVSDGEGGCDPILPPEPCPPGTMEIIGQTECQPVGVTQCAEGFVSDGEGGCDAILPPGPDPCPFGTMEVLGHTECQPVGDCGTSTWGNITTDATTVFVDQTADATSADGSDASPFTTIADALAAVQPGGQIAVAAGEYVERLVVNQRVHLAGRCAELVTIRGTTFLGQDRPPVTVNSGGSGSSVRGVTLTGDAQGLLVNGATNVTVEEAQVVGTGSVGVYLGEEAEANLRGVVVSGCTWVGILSEGSRVEVSESVVRETNALPDGRYGRGIQVQCSLDGVCGSIDVTASLLSGNREMGISIAGVDVAIMSTVVRNTQSEESDGTSGRGIEAQCSERSNACSSLTVTGSLVVGNRDAGIVTGGVDAVITSTVVRDTLPQQRDSAKGAGIVALCYPGLDACGSLTVTGSLVAGNRELGIFAGGVDAAVTSTVVRDTLPQESDGKKGFAIAALCDRYLGTCGNLAVTGSLVAGNTHMGIFTWGVDAAITSTVVRDTLAQESDATGGRGIQAWCDADLGICGSLNVTGSLVAGNREAGIFTAGVETGITSTVIRDTLPQESDRMFGRGINANCDPDSGTCGSLTVAGSLVAGNRDVGIATYGADAGITSTVVRNTLSQEGDGMFGLGIASLCDPDSGTCGSLTVAGSLVAGNRGVGIFIPGVDAVIGSTVVRETLPHESDGMGGRGINAQCNPDLATCGSLTVTASLVSGNEDEGIFISGVHAVLSGVAVKDTVTNETGPWAGEYGQAVFAMCHYPDQARYCPLLQMTHCLVESSYSAGVAIQGGSGSMYGSLIRNVYPRPLDNAYGYGLQVEGLAVPGAGQTFFDVQSCRIIDATLAGALYVRAQGTVSGSQVSGAEFSIVMNEGSSVTVADDNQLSGIYEDEPTWQNLEPSPVPGPAMPVENQ